MVYKNRRGNSSVIEPFGVAAMHGALALLTPHTVNEAAWLTEIHSRIWGQED